MKILAHIPTQSYGFIQVEGNEDQLDEIEALYNRYAESKLNFSKGKFIEFDTFTGERIRYNDTTHEYTDLQGNVLISGSQYKKKFEKPFDKQTILPKMVEKYGVPADVIDRMWTANSKISTTFGNAIHYAMEQWFAHNGHGTEKEWHLPKHPFLLNVVNSFPDKDTNVIPEAIISCVALKMCGRVDGIQVVDADKKIAKVLDYKSDADVKKNLPIHFRQLSFYAHILTQFGWSIPEVVVWNFTTEWTSHSSKPLEIIYD